MFCDMENYYLIIMFKHQSLSVSYEEVNILFFNLVALLSFTLQV